jgi:group II intron reverse transcriptase/maturase
MDCIRTFYSNVHTQKKYFWAIEGDIRKCFDRVNHTILLKLIQQRIADQRIVNLINAFLTAGVMDNALFHDTPEGTPQGGILSPLLANIYLHQLDLWWWRKFGGLSQEKRTKRRQTRLGNAVMTRYADDFCILWNGTHEQAKLLKAELRQFVWDELHLELSEEKTHITHMTDGLDFLGYHIQWELPKDGHKPWLRVTPTRANLARFRAKLKAQTKRQTTQITPDTKFKSLNRIIQGWGNYYQHVSFSHDAHKLDFWINRRVLIWLHHKHQRRPIKWLLKRYKKREVCSKSERWNFATKDVNAKDIFIGKLSDKHLTPYLPKKRDNPYLEAHEVLIQEETETPFLDTRIGNVGLKGLEWLERRREVIARDNGRCVRCGANNILLDAHHIIPRKDGGTDELDNLITLCQKCHAKTPSYGKRKGDEKILRKAG